VKPVSGMVRESDLQLEIISLILEAKSVPLGYFRYTNTNISQKVKSFDILLKKLNRPLAYYFFSNPPILSNLKPAGT
jgi:hypothetical protein